MSDIGFDYAPSAQDRAWEDAALDEYAAAHDAAIETCLKEYGLDLRRIRHSDLGSYGSEIVARRDLGPHHPQGARVTIDPRLVARWDTGERDIPDWIGPALVAVLTDRAGEALNLARRLQRGG